MSQTQQALQAPFATYSAMLALTAANHPNAIAIICEDQSHTFVQLNNATNQIAATLQRDAIAPTACIAILANGSYHYIALFLGALRAGIAVAPLAPGSSPASIAAMIANAQAQRVFVDAANLALLSEVPPSIAARTVVIDDIPTTANAAQSNTERPIPLGQWLMPQASQPTAVDVQPDWPFNLIYSSGTTGNPKGIIQPHSMRWFHVQRAATNGYGPTSITLTATPLYSNTTLVSLFPTLVLGGCVVLMKKFDALQYLTLAQRHRVTHTMLVPVQYQRLMAHPQFDTFNLTSFQMKFCTSAPFSGALKADVLKRWPGGLTEYYGMTEGGGTCILFAHLHPNKLGTVGQPAANHDIRLIDELGAAVPVGQMGEVVGHSPAMMTGYYGQPELTRQAEWFDANGKRFIRTGDIGRFDDDGFLTLMDRKKDMIISGGFNIYPSDLEAVLMQHPQVFEAAVVGELSEQWGETPVAYVVLRTDATATGISLIDAETLRLWANEQLGKVQRVSRLVLVDSLPRNAIGKVLKSALRIGK
jgi:long-chain acyl-CoA synthetase